VILGAAVVDDVLGLVVLAIVAGAIGAAEGGAGVSFGSVAWILGKAIAFLVGALIVGVYTTPIVFRWAARLRTKGVLLALGLAFCFALAWLASVIGLAPIVGAFTAGLILEAAHYRDFTAKGEPALDELVHPIAAFLTPVFFVLMGMRTNLASFAAPGVPLLALALIVAAIVGKQVCSLGVLGKGIDRLTVGIGMVPRGEVGLIFANIGLGLTAAGAPVVAASTYSAIVAMVIVTTVVTPPALKWGLRRAERRKRQ
jgi:Kef-type K+ transport system membrane component KefB